MNRTETQNRPSTLNLEKLSPEQAKSVEQRPRTVVVATSSMPQYSDGNRALFPYHGAC
ncbi:MAG: hypothetical protein HUU21_08055 [Polyangiaceae bacterium]|nr:hypothetical protein [Polyangiaceae bacterium]